MSLPNVKGVLARWSRIYLLKTVTDTTVDFVRTPVVVSADIDAVVQPANKARLNIEQIDWTLDYLLIHTADTLAMGQFLEFDGRDFKIVSLGSWGIYGFTEGIGEETKRTLLVVTP